MARIVIAALALLAAATAARAHGVNWSVLDAEPVAVRFSYSGGEPMSYAEVKVFGPHSAPELEHQNGRTDARGVFAFLPDGPGNWTVQARDESGHRGAVEVAVGDGSGAAPQAAAAAPTTGRALLGLSLLLNLALGALLLRARKARRT